MPLYQITQDWTAFVTLHSAADGAARSEAKGDVENVLAGAAATDRITAWDIIDVKVAEPPMAPFEPFTVSVSGHVSVSVEAADEESAMQKGQAQIEDALSVLENFHTTSTPSVTSAA